MPDLVGPPIEQDALTALRQQLAQIDADRQATLDQATADQAQRLGELATAGQEYDDRVAAAESQFNQGMSDYTGMLNTVDQHLDEAQTATDAISDAPVTLTRVHPQPVPTTATPDCAAADVETALNSLVDALNEIIGEIEAQFNAGNTGNVKTALGRLKDVGQTLRSTMPAAEDSEAEKAARYAEVDGLY